MTIIEVIAAAALCALILSAILIVKEGMVTPLRPDEDTSVLFLVRSSGKAEGLEQTVKGLMLICDPAGSRANIVICDEGLCREAKRAAEMLADDNKKVSLCLSGHIDTIVEDITWREKNERPE